MSSWRDELEVGSKVILRGDTLENSIISKVSRLTKTQIVIGAGTTKYRRDSGYPVGEYSWYSKSLCEYSESLAEEIRCAHKKRRLVEWLNEFEWKDKSTEDLERIYKSLV